MRDEQKWKLALSQFNAIRTNLPGYIPEALVNEYHAVLDLMASASDEDFSSFCVPQADIKPRVVSFQMGSRRSPGRAHYSSDNFCDSNLFDRKIAALSHYLPTIEEIMRNQPKPVPETPKDYWSMSTVDLELLASKYQIGGYAAANGPIDRDLLIKGLLARDRAIRGENPVPHQTINVGQMHGSSIQQGSPGSTATINFNTPDVQKVIQTIKGGIADIPMSEEAKGDIELDIETVERQLSSPRPRLPIVRESLRSMRAILEGVVAGLMADGLFHHADKVTAWMHDLAKFLN
jgi:hypothetical protein